MTIEQILQLEEGQTFDRKSINIDPTDLASTICSFANADGGDIAIGITNRKRLIEGVDFEMNKLNDILRAPLDYCSPTVEIETEYVPCVDMKGQENQCSCNTFIWKESAVVFSTCQSEIHSV